MAAQIKKSTLLTLQDAISSLHFGKRWYFEDNAYHDYSKFVWEESSPKPSLDEITVELNRLKVEADKEQYVQDRKLLYPTTDEWMEAFLQKELDNQPQQWNELVEKRRLIKIQNPK